MVVHLNTSPMTVFRCPARDNSVPLSEIYCAYLVTDSARTAAGLLPLLVRILRNPNATEVIFRRLLKLSALLK